MQGAYFFLHPASRQSLRIWEGGWPECRDQWAVNISLEMCAGGLGRACTEASLAMCLRMYSAFMLSLRVLL